MEHEDLTLDPADWQLFSSTATRMLTDTVAYLEALREQPAWRAMPDDVRQSFTAPVPWDGAGLDRAYQEFLHRVRPYTNGNLHPRFFGWVMGNGTPVGMMADMLASGINAHMAGFNQAPALVEDEVLRWMAELMGMPGASGLLVSGGMMANTLGLTVARHVGAGFDIRAEGLQGGRPPLVFYGSTETHGWATRAAELLGLGRRSFRQVPVDEGYRIDLRALAAAIRADRDAGMRPFCVVATAGTTNTGSTDDLNGVADICQREGIWFHIDGAFGAMAYPSARLRPALAGMERADSLGVDLHKWGWLPFECACVLVRDADAHAAALSIQAAYLNETERGVMAGGIPFADRGLELTRSFKALKVWLSFQAHGVAAIIRIIEQNVEQARYLAERIATHAELELLAPVPLNVVCFRYRVEGIPDRELNALNEEILLRMQEAGEAVPSGTVLGGRYSIRVCIVNHRTRYSDVDAVVEAALRHGRALAGAAAGR